MDHWTDNPPGFIVHNGEIWFLKRDTFRIQENRREYKVMTSRGYEQNSRSESPDLRAITSIKAAIYREPLINSYHERHFLYLISSYPPNNPASYYLHFMHKDTEDSDREWKGPQKKILKSDYVVDDYLLK